MAILRPGAHSQRTCTVVQRAARWRPNAAFVVEVKESERARADAMAWKPWYTRFHAEEFATELHARSSEPFRGGHTQCCNLWKTKPLGARLDALGGCVHKSCHLAAFARGRPLRRRDVLHNLLTGADPFLHAAKKSAAAISAAERRDVAAAERAAKAEKVAQRFAQRSKRTAITTCVAAAASSGGGTACAAAGHGGGRGGQCCAAGHGGGLCGCAAAVAATVAATGPPTQLRAGMGQGTEGPGPRLPLRG
ncbi:hypothetical protein RI054_23g100130 [Pseudoscourfieldia marina]